MTAIETAVQGITMSQLAVHDGLQINRANKVKCVFHEDNTASMQVFKGVPPEKNGFFCHACRVGGDVVKYWQLRTGMSAIESALDLLRIFNMPDPNPNARSQPKLKLTEQEVQLRRLDKILAFCEYVVRKCNEPRASKQFLAEVEAGEHVFSMDQLISTGIMDKYADYIATLDDRIVEADVLLEEAMGVTFEANVAAHTINRRFWADDEKEAMNAYNKELVDGVSRKAGNLKKRYVYIESGVV